jgi:predicted DNA binding CopG/RHH family protein
MDKRKLDELREHYDTTDLSESIEAAVLDETVADNPMIGITVRFPKSALDRVRAIADERGVKVTALIRDIVERSIAGEPQGDLVIPVAVLQRLIAEQAKPPAA